MRRRIAPRAVRSRARTAATVGIALLLLHCGLLGSPGEYGGGGDLPAEAGANEAGAADGTTTDVTVTPDGQIVVPGSAGTIVLLAGEREASSPDDEPALAGDAWSGVLDADGKVAAWKVDKSAPISGPFDCAGLVGTSWFALNTGFLGTFRSSVVQSTSWGPGVTGDWKAARGQSPGGLDDITRTLVGPHVVYVGGQRTVPIDGGTTTFFVNEVHAADLDLTARTMGGTANTGKQIVVARSRPGLLVSGAAIYVAGGRFNGGITASVEFATVDLGTGDITGNFAEGPAMSNGGVDHKVYAPQMAIGEGHLFVAGGRTTNQGASTDVVISSKVDAANSELGPWKAVTKLPKPLRDFAFVAHKGRLYVAGGMTPDTPSRTDEVYSAKIDADGTLGPWDAANAKLPAPRSDFVTLAY